MGFWNGKPVKTHMTQLVTALGELAAQYGAWVRLHYVYPYPHVDQIIPLMAQGKVLPYLDVPLQHAHPDVLKRMKRPASGEKNIERIQAWRAMCPDLTIRSTFIAGFPGETDAEFDYLLDFLKEAEIDRLGCFAYSPVEGATANALDNPVPEELREERRGRVMQLQEEISKKRLQAKVGKTMRVLIDEVDRNGGIGRSSADAPEIDGVVYVKPPYEPHKKLVVGEFVDVTITASDAHDLWAAA
jgi:ribosomal protein S12 methylthiotransferase